MNIPKKVLLLVIITLFDASQSFSQWALDTVISTGTNTSGIAITSNASKLVITNNTNPGSIKIISLPDYAVSNIDISSIENYPNGVTITPDDSIAIVNTLHRTIFVDLFSHLIKWNFTAPCAGTTLYGIAVTPNGHNAVFPDLSSGCTQQGLRSVDVTGQIPGSSFIQISTSGELYGIAVTPDGTSAIVTTYTSDSPKKVNLLTSGVQDITGMVGSYGLAIFHSGNEALIFDGDSLDRVSLINNSVTKKISLLTYNTSFQNIAITTDDKYAFVVGAFEKLIVSLADDSVIQTFSAGGTNVATTPDGSKFFVTDSYNGTVRVYKKQNTSAVETDNYQIPSTFTLKQNYPNPFNPSTNLQFQIPVSGRVVIKVYNVLGAEVGTLMNEMKQPGVYNFIWNASSLPSGVYFYRLSCGNFVEVKKAVLLK